MFRIAIVEDEKMVADQLKGYIDRYCKENTLEATVVEFPDGMEIVEDFHPIWDMILLDIKMPHLDGMSVARYIRSVDPSVILIFITNVARFAIKGYEVDAMAFILKPVVYAQFAMQMKKAVNFIHAARQRKQRYLFVSTGNGEQRISTDDILYIEVINHRLHIHTHNGEFEMHGSLREMEQQLMGLPFMRCSHSYMINLHNVTGIQKNSVIVYGQEVAVSRTKRKELLQSLSDYIGGRFQ